MKQFIKHISASWLMGGLFIFLAATMAMATFIENDYGAAAAKALVYNTWWFELIFLLLAINMIGNIILFKMGKKGGVSVFLFHVSFLLIIIGAAITRYISFEGMMHIREGESSNTMMTTDPHVKIVLATSTDSVSFEKYVFLTPATPTEFSKTLKLGAEKVKIKSIAYIPNAMMRPVDMPEGEPILGLVFSNKMAREEIFLKVGESAERESIVFGFENNNLLSCDVSISMDQSTGALEINSLIPLSKVDMQSGNVTALPVNTQNKLEQGVLYDFGNFRMVLSRFFPSATLQPTSVPGEMGAGLPNAVAFQVDNGGNSYQLIAYGERGNLGKPALLKLGDLTLSVSYGSLPISLPFSLRLNRFILERYPGSQSPSSYTSKVTLIDDEKNINRQEEIFMNNILNYRGYRFFQSSYDVDEKGTVLSVNHDAVGTIITYIGYFLMSLGMFWALFAPKTRFRNLMKKASQIYDQRKKLTLLLMLIVPLSASAQIINTPPSPDNLVAEKFGAIWVQDNGGRIKPLNSLHQEIVIKLVKHNSFHDLTSDQIILGMLTYPMEWQAMPMITVKNPQLKAILGITGKKAAFNDFFTPNRQYKIHEWVDKAYRKDPSSQNKLEQEIIKIDEQVNVFYMAQMGSLHKLFPSPKNLNLPWYALDAQTKTLPARDSLFVSSVMGRIVNHIRQGNNSAAIIEMEGITQYQESHSEDILPTNTHLKLELLYNQLNVFLWLATYFFILGGLLLLMQFVALLKPAFYFKWLMVAGNTLLFAGFLYYCFGLALRWVVSGHAPWSNGYESMIFIGWAILLAGFLMSRKSNLVLPITGLFAGVVLMVAHLSWMNPQITNLVPVLKSYWLTLHVSVIIGGYGFLALGALLGFLNLFFTVLKTKSNNLRLQLTIDELTAINEMAITAGLYLMTIGSFLGGVWANESWGRYWGWDPKETWSLITIVLYAFVIHMRLIPGMKGFVAFNTATLITFASVIMTYLGVNYYLAGLHSYGSGDPVPIPTFVYYTIGVVVVLIFVARYNQTRFENNETTIPN